MAATAEDQEHVVASAAKQEDSGWVAECLAGASRMQAPRWRIVAIMQASRQVEPHPLHRHLTGIAPRHGLLLGTIKSNDEMVGLVDRLACASLKSSVSLPCASLPATGTGALAKHMRPNSTATAPARVSSTSFPK